MADHKYWIQFVLLVREPTPPPPTEAGVLEAPPQEFMDTIGILLKSPISEFDHVNSLAGMIANIRGQERKAAPGMVQVKVLSWTKLEEASFIYLPEAKSN